MKKNIIPHKLNEQEWKEAIFLFPHTKPRRHKDVSQGTKYREKINIETM